MIGEPLAEKRVKLVERRNMLPIVQSKVDRYRDSDIYQEKSFGAKKMLTDIASGELIMAEHSTRFEKGQVRKTLKEA